MTVPLRDRGMYGTGQPVDTARFQAATHRHAAMAGVTKPSFICRQCGRPRGAAGRKPLVPGAPKHGYVCAECAAPKAAEGESSD